MTEERKVQLGVSVDATGAREGFNEVKREAQSMAQSVAQSGSTASKAVNGIGSGGDSSAKKVDAATRSMIQSIQRTTAVMEAGSKSSSKYYETLASQRGVDVDALKPYLAQLDAVAAKQKVAEQAVRSAESGIKSVGISAAQTAAAMRGVPAQMTDIVTSLQGGQRPMSVFLQQGGQLRDMFGGIGPAAKALGSHVAGLINPFTVAAAAAGALGLAHFYGRKEAENYSKALIMSGNIVGTTASELELMARRMDSMSGTQREAAAALAAMAGSGSVAKRNLEEFTAVALRMEDVVGKSVAETIKDFEALGRSPVEASLKLNEQYRYLTAAVFEQIAALQAQGREEEAAAVAQKAFSDAFDQRTKEVSQNLGLLETGWKSVKKVASEAIDEMLRIGRDKTLADQLNVIDEKLASHNPFALFGPSRDELTAQREAIIESMRLEQRAATSAAERAAINQAGAIAIDAVTKANDKALSKQEQMNRALEIYKENIEKIRRANPDSDLLDPKKIAATEKAIRDSYKEGGAAPAAKARNDQLEREHDMLLKLAGVSKDYLQQLETLQSLRAKGLVTEEAYVGAIEDLIKLQPGAKEMASAFADAGKASLVAADARLKFIGTLETGLDKLKADVLSQREHNAQIGLSKEAIAELAAAKLEDQAVTLDGLALKELDKNLDQEKYDLYRAQAQALRDLASEKRAGAAIQASVDSAEEHRKAWEKANDDISRSLTDAIMRGGKNAGEYLKDYFRTLVLRPIVQMIVNPIAGAFAGMLGLPGAASAATGAGGASNAMSLLSAGKTMWEGFRSGIGATTGGWISSAGNLLGSSSISAFGSGFGMTSAQAAQAAAAYNAAGMSGVANSISYGQMAGTAASWAGGIAGGIYGGRAISGGYSLNGGSGNSAVNIGAAVGAVLGAGPVGALIGGIIGGAVNRLFGRGPKKVQAFGIEGDFDIDGFSGRGFSDWKRKGGAFRSSKRGTDYSALDASVIEQFTSGMVALKGSTADMAAALGLSADAIDGYSRHIRLTLTKDEAENQKRIAELFGVMGDELATLVADFSVLAKEGETAGTTLQRLATSLTTANSWLSLFDFALFQASMTGGDLASKLADAFGGLENLNTASAAFYNAYYSETERVERRAEDMQAAFAALRLAVPETMGEFRDLAGSLDLTTEAGRTAYAALLSIAPEFASITEATARLAKEAATKFVEAFIGNDQVFPLLAEAQRDVGMLNAQVDALGVSAERTAIDFAGLDAALAGVNTATFIETMAQVFENLGQRLSSIVDGIARERGAVRGAALQIINPAAMSKEAIRAEIASINTEGPNNANLLAALAGLDAAKGQQTALDAQRANVVATYEPLVDGSLAQYNAARDESDSALDAYQAMLGSYGKGHSSFSKLIGRILRNFVKTDATAIIDRLMPTSGGVKTADYYTVAEDFDAGTKFSAGGYVMSGAQAEKDRAAYEAYSGAFDAARAALEQYNQYAATMAEKLNEVAAQQASVTANINTASAQARQAQIDYADALQSFAIEAGQSVSKLSRLREETMRYYEAQKQVAELMTASAKGLRQTLTDYRYGQLTSEEQLTSLLKQFGSAYSMAISTDGEVLSGYADKLNTLVNPLLEKAREVYGAGDDFNALAALVFARGQSVAARLETLTPTDYAADSLQLLEQIDATLAALESSTRSAESLVVDAINTSRDQTVGGLRAVVAALTGQSVPAFATGGYHAGGLRLVGEKGPELEVTGPARIFSASQTSQLLAGSNNAELVAELRALRQENGELRFALEAIASHTSNTARRLERIEADGMVVRTEDDMPLKTEAA